MAVKGLRLFLNPFTALKAETTYLRGPLTRPITNPGFINHSGGNFSPRPET